jgi:hypothetical protein
VFPKYLPGGNVPSHISVPRGVHGMKTAVGIILAAVLAAGIGAVGSVVTLNSVVASVDKAANNANQANLGTPAGYGQR